MVLATIGRVEVCTRFNDVVMMWLQFVCFLISNWSCREELNGELSSSCLLLCLDFLCL